MAGAEAGAEVGPGAEPVRVSVNHSVRHVSGGDPAPAPRLPPAHGRRQREQQGAAAGAHSAASRRLEARRREPRGAKGLGASFQNEFDYNDDSANGGSVDGDDLPPRADEGELAAAVRFAAHAAAMPSGGGYSSLMARGVAGATSGVAAVRRSVDAGAPRQRAPKKPVWKRDPVPLTLMQ
ncbi:hypothetical protein T492DRAFT_911340 [Pavlovales sp. CCMP2436]|nr:hypothetical protein T492DRAFT_911340 [Pavlovales sp. CCMP2436]